MSMFDAVLDGDLNGDPSLDHVPIDTGAGLIQGLQVHYQSIVDCNSRVASVEALVRLRIGAHQVSAEAVVRHFRRRGMLDALGKAVHQLAIQEFAEGLGLLAGVPTLHLNVSAEELSAPGFNAQLLTMLAIYGVPASSITLELTEDAPLQLTPSVVGRLMVLRDMGMGLAVDDFGTGHNQLLVLRHLPATHLKIDGQYIAGIKPDDKIVGGIIRIAHDLGMVVIAEGVEDHQQFCILADMGCDQFQGYYFSRPVAALAG